MVALYKLLITLTSLILLLATDFVDSTWDDAEGGSISVPTDKLSWLQVSICDNFGLCQLHLIPNSPWLEGNRPLCETNFVLCSNRRFGSHGDASLV
jgi:hypothetical protein